MDEEMTIAPSRAGPPSGEAGSLAREMGRAYRRMVSYYRKEMTLAEADALASNPAGADIEHVIDTPPDQLSWWVLGRLAEHDPEAALTAWRRIAAAAQVELASGHRASLALEWDSKPWERARFLAIRQAFIDEWRPRGASS